MSQPIVTSTRQNAFTIPFRIEPAQHPNEQPTEVQLHLSTNRGATWELSARVPPEKGAFVFRAPHDGEYWYSIRTVDKSGTARPEGPHQAQLKVTVDTVAPRLDLSVTRGASGEISARWQAVDPNLKPGSFKLEYQANSSGPWQPVAVTSPPEAMRHTHSGEATWWPNTNDPVLVRAEISDAAGNPAVSQAVVRPGETSAQNNLPREPAGSSNLAGKGQAASNSPAAENESWRTRRPDTMRWPADRSTTEPLARSAAGDDLSPRDPDSRLITPEAAGESRPSVRAQQVAQRAPFAGSGPADYAALPGRERPRMVNSRNFELEYEIDSVGPSGIGKVELWGTRDGGRTWSSYGLDPDQRSPMSVGVEGEGLYGFRIVVQSGSGFGGRPPAEGDQPDLWIGVDLTKPRLRITGAEMGPDGGELLIRWEAQDELPDTRPVSLSFATTPQGPWTPIASGLENSGSYGWRLDTRVPDRIYLRLQMRDEAGNVGSFETAEPVALDRYRPEGRIRGVRPIGGG